MYSTPTRELIVLQYNIRGERDTVMTPLLADRSIADIDVIAIQEPVYDKYRRSSYNPGTSDFHLAFEGDGDTRVCLYVNKRLDVDNWETTYKSNKLCSVKLSMDPLRPDRKSDLWIHNVYNPPLLIGPSHWQPPYSRSWKKHWARRANIW